MIVCAGIVLFYPDIDRLQQNIDAVLPQADRLFIVDNTPEDEKIKEKLVLVGDYKWIQNKENLGMAAALNQLLSAADSDGFKWLLTLDQDSICAEGLADTLYIAAKDYMNAAMVAPRVIENGKEWDYDTSRRHKKRIIKDVEEVKFCITSGTLTNIKAVQHIGGWDGKLFIDEVDIDICIRLRYRGFRIIRVNKTEIKHEFGLDVKRKKILFKTYQYRNYSPFRVYYQTRNLVYMVRKYGADYKSHPAWRLIRPIFVFMIKFIIQPQRFKRLSAFIRGYAAGWRMQL